MNHTLIGVGITQLWNCQYFKRAVHRFGESRQSCQIVDVVLKTHFSDCGRIDRRLNQIFDFKFEFIIEFLIKVINLFDGGNHFSRTL